MNWNYSPNKREIVIFWLFRQSYSITQNTRIQWKNSKWKAVAKKIMYTWVQMIWNDWFLCHVFWSFSLYSYLWTDARQQLTNPRWNVQVQNWTLVVKVDFFFKLEGKLNLHEFYREVCTNFPLGKKTLKLKKVAQYYFSCFQILVISRAWTIIYLKCITSKEFMRWYSGTHKSILHLATWYLIYHIKEYTVEVIKQDLLQCAIPTSWTIVKKKKKQTTLANLGSSNQKKKGKSVHKMSSQSKSTAWVKDWNC